MNNKSVCEPADNLIIARISLDLTDFLVGSSWIHYSRDVYGMYSYINGSSSRLAAEPLREEWDR